jgi:hypothetical protein
MDLRVSQMGTSFISLYMGRTKVCQKNLFKIVIFSTDNVDPASLNPPI